MNKSDFLREILLKINNVCTAANGDYADKMKALSLLYTAKDNMSGNLGISFQIQRLILQNATFIFI